MKQQVETELKTIITKEQFERLTNIYAPLHFIKQHNIYYFSNDTDSYAFRIRLKENEKLFTLKQYIDGKTYEYEKSFSGDFEDDEEIINILNFFQVNRPYSIIGELTTYRAVVDTGKAELCFDINHYNGITDYEIEYEIYCNHDYHNEFESILKKVDITYKKSWGSKYHRCLSSTSNK